MGITKTHVQVQRDQSFEIGIFLFCYLFWGNYPYNDLIVETDYLLIIGKKGKSLNTWNFEEN